MNVYRNYSEQQWDSNRKQRSEASDQAVVFPVIDSNGLEGRGEPVIQMEGKHQH